MLVGELRVRDGELPLQVGTTGLLEPAVGLGVDPRDEEAGDGEHPRRVAARGHQALEPAHVGLGDGRVALEREDQRHVDRSALGDAVLDRAEPGLGGGDLHVQVVALHLAVEPHRLLVRALAVVGERRVDLERHPAVDAVRSLPGRAHQVAGGADVVHREREEHLDRVVARDRAQLRVVPVALRQRLLEDGRVGGDSDDGVLLHQPGELAGLEHLAREGVDPDADAVLAQLVQP